MLVTCGVKLSLQKKMPTEIEVSLRRKLTRLQKHISDEKLGNLVNLSKTLESQLKDMAVDDPQTYYLTAKKFMCLDQWYEAKDALLKYTALLEDPLMLQDLNKKNNTDYKVKDPLKDNSYYYLWLCQSRMNSQIALGSDSTALMSSVGSGLLDRYEAAYKKWFQLYPRTGIEQSISENPLLSVITHVPGSSSASSSSSQSSTTSTSTTSSSSSSTTAG